MIERGAENVTDAVFEQNQLHKSMTNSYSATQRFSLYKQIAPGEGTSGLFELTVETTKVFIFNFSTLLLPEFGKVKTVVSLPINHVPGPPFYDGRENC